MSEYRTHTITCLKNDGKIVYQYKDEDLIQPQGMFVDDEDNVMVCGGQSSTVHVIRAAGMKHRR